MPEWLQRTLAAVPSDQKAELAHWMRATSDLNVSIALWEAIDPTDNWRDERAGIVG